MVFNASPLIKAQALFGLSVSEILGHEKSDAPAWLSLL